MTLPNRPLRLAFIIPSLRGGGAERSTLAIARGLIARGYAVDLVLLNDNIALRDEVHQDARVLVLKHKQCPTTGPRVRVLARLGLTIALLLRKRNIRHAISIAEYVNSQRPDVLLPTLPDAKIASLLATQFLAYNLLLVPVVRNNVMSRGRRNRALYRALFRFADHSVAVSSGVAESLTTHSKVFGDQVTTIYNPVITEQLFAQAEESPDHPWFIDAGPPIVLAAGRLSRVKDFPTLLRAFEIAARDRPLRLVILGEGSWRTRLERLVRTNGLCDRVSLPGWVPNPFAYMKRASVFVVSSRFEGLSGVLIQALACGCPCVSTDCPSGSREILQNGRIGPLVPVGDSLQLSQAIQHLLDSPPQPNVLVSRAKQFEVQTAVASYESLLKILLRPRSSRSASEFLKS